MGIWESSKTPKNSEFDRRGQSTLPWSFFYTIEKVLKCRCRKWPRMSHLDICSTSYGRKKGWESNWQFDYWPLKVENRPEVMNSQSCESPNRDSFRTPPWESQEKVSFGCRCRGQMQRILYGGRWWLPRVRAVVSHVSPGAPMACPNTESASECKLTNLLVGLM
jgi:hypothetical protein